jgi:hypothetical protein
LVREALSQQRISFDSAARTRAAFAKAVIAAGYRGFYFFVLESVSEHRTKTACYLRIA